MSDRPGPALFFLRGLEAGFDGRTVLSIDRLSIAERGITALVGENGSGKTTLLRVLGGLQEPSAGSLEFRGMPAGGSNVRMQSVLMHQAPLLFRGTVGQNVGYGLRVRRVARQEAARRVARALERVGLPGFEGRRASALSGGEKQRVALARVIVLESPVLLLDEPTSNVDADSRMIVERVISESAASGVTVIVSTHATDLAYRLGDAMVRLEAGRVAPLHENILKGSVESTDEHFTRFRVAGRGGPVLLCPARQGTFRVAVIPNAELLLSAAPLDSSARNQLRGWVTAIAPQESLLRVSVDCGTVLCALITRASAEELRVTPGREIVVTFKASAIRLY
jgi:tungstate transport system ATP-binding protein